MSDDVLLKPVAAETDALPHRTVLIVDDDVQQAEVLALRLSNQGFHAVTACLGQDGLTLARQLHPHVILLDLRLPDVDGLEICRRLTDGPDTCDVPVIIVSGMERSDVVRSSRAAGSRFYLRKPYDPNALLTLIQQAIQQSESW